MKIQTILLLVGAILTSRLAAAAPAYNCTTPRPEMAGFHNMVLFGVPDDELYVYHLPLFAGTTNGTAGHVLMHVYQGLWNVQLDVATKSAYDLKFSQKRTLANPFPFFSIGPKGNLFKVPEMICNSSFSFTALAVFGHVENNPDFPQPSKLINGLSAVTMKGQPVFARRFDGAARSALTYFIFGTPKQHYMVHFLTDDENSFDQIVGIEILGADLKAAVESTDSTWVTVPIVSGNGLIPIIDNAAVSSPNNKWKLPVSPLGKTVTVNETKSGLTGQIKIIGEVYSNANDDLKK